MNKDLLLAIDNGTQSVRALLFDLQGTLLVKARIPIEPYFSTAPGLAEQDPRVFWDAACQASRKLWANGRELRERVAAITLTTQRGTIINVDRQGTPLRPAIVWPDQRHTYGLPPVGGLWGLLFRLAGIQSTVAYLQSEAEVNWIRTHEPEVWAKTHKVLLVSGYLTYCMTGRFVDSVGCQAAYLPFDYKGQRWAPGYDWKWQAVQIPPEFLTDLVPPTGQLGELTPAAAEAMDLPVGLPVIAAASDKACEVIGAGALEPHIGCLSYGTTATINTTHKRYIEVIPLIPPYPAAVPHAYSLEVQIFRGYWMVSWFKQQFGHPERHLAAEREIEAEELFDELVRSAPPGSDGLILQPYWTPGIRVPGPEARGAVIGFTDIHTRAHVYRAMLEGLAYGLREGADRTVKRSGVPITELRVAGGGSQSTAAMQLTADVFGLPTARPHVYEASGLGAAIDAAVGAQLHPDFATAVSAMTHLGECFEPQPAAQAVYNDLYHQVYLHMYGKLKPLYERIRDIVVKRP